MIFPYLSVASHRCISSFFGSGKIFRVSSWRHIVHQKVCRHSFDNSLSSKLQYHSFFSLKNYPSLTTLWITPLESLPSTDLHFFYFVNHNQSIHSFIQTFQCDFFCQVNSLSWFSFANNQIEVERRFLDPSWAHSTFRWFLWEFCLNFVSLTVFSVKIWRENDRWGYNEQSPASLNFGSTFERLRGRLNDGMM
jgi:hypothetical protein